MAEEHPVNERVVALEVKMAQVEKNQDVLFGKLESMDKWLRATAISAIGGLVVALATIVGKKMGIL